MSSLESLLGKLAVKEKDALDIADTLELLSEDKWKDRAAKIRGCGSEVTFALCPICQTAHIRHVKLCRDRLCPACAWRLARRRVGVLSAALAHLAQTAPARLFPIMLTLTVENVPPDGLKAACEGMLQAYGRLIKQKAYKAAIAGHARTLEITYNQDEDTFHPHIHALLLYKPGQYIEQPQWADMWKAAEKLPYTPITDVRAAYNPKETAAGSPDAWLKTSAEVAKYITAPDSLQALSPYNLSMLGEAIEGRRIHTLGGIIKDAAAATKRTDPPGLVCSHCKNTMEEVTFKKHGAADYYN